jgi:hypothetical protein
MPTVSKFGSIVEIKAFYGIRNFLLTLHSIIYSRESILPVLFTTKSCDSPHRFSGGSSLLEFSLLSFNTESRYSLYCILQTATTPRLICSGESLLTAELFSKTLKNSPSL